MAYKRSIMAGMTNYTGVPIEDIISDINNWETNTKTAIRDLRSYREKVEANRDRINHPDAIIGHIRYFLDHFERFAGKFSRLGTELAVSVEQRHIAALEQIVAELDSMDSKCGQFSNDHIYTTLKDESLRHGLIDAIHSDTRGMVVDFKDLSNLISRLEALSGLSFAKEETQKGDPPGLVKHFHWFNSAPKRWLLLFPLLVISIFWNSISNSISTWISGVGDEESVYAVITDFGVSDADTSVFFNLLVTNNNIDPVTIITAYISAADSASLHQGWYGECTFSPPEFEPVIIEAGKTISRKIHFGHSVTHYLQNFYPSQTHFFLSANFVTLDSGRRSHWAKSRISFLYVVNGLVVGSSNNPPIEIQLIPARLDNHPPINNRPPGFSVSAQPIIIPPARSAPTLRED